MGPDSDPLSIKFTTLLKVFHGIIDGNPPAEKVKDKLLSLKEKAKDTPELNYHQLSAITARCDNYINGEYGNTKVASNFGHAKPEKK